MKDRLISAGVGIILCLALLFFGEMNPLVIQIAISLVTGLTCGELLTAKGLHEDLKISGPCMLFGILMPLLCTTVFKFLPLYIFMLLMFIFMVVFHDKLKANDVVFAYGGSLLITLSMTSLVLTVCSDSGFTAFYVVLTLAVPWLSDSGAFFAGITLGKHKLCPVISPKKTVEGAVGGLVSGFLGAFLIAYVFSFIYKGATFDYIAIAIIGLLNPVISIFGDLTFSVIKRSCGVKDYGSIMPGHGGMLDRFDSIIFCAPLVFIVTQFFTIIS